MEWLDGHASKYSPDWLYRRRLEPDGVQDRLTKVYTGVVDTPWSSCDPQQIIKRRSYDDVSITVFTHYDILQVELCHRSCPLMRALFL